ncbi:MAG: type II toxin-antitoxin system ParD family antitoxin [Rhodospirillales bacterium]
MNISLPDVMKSFVDEQVSTRGYSTSSEYVRDLIRKDQDREKLRALLLEGGNSPLTGEANEAYFDSLHELARRSRSE